MADLKVRQLSDEVADALRTRAARKGISLEEEVRGTLSASVEFKRQAFLRRAKAIRASIGDTSAAPSLESTRLIRKERDRRG
jgi:plasmid stability protein